MDSEDIEFERLRALANSSPTPVESSKTRAVRFSATGKGVTAKAIQEMMAQMAKQQEIPSFSAPEVKSSTITTPSVSHELPTAKEDIEFQKLQAKAQATSFKDLIPSKKELGDKFKQMVNEPKKAFIEEPSQGARVIREWMTSAAPTQEDIAKISEEKPGEVPYGAIAARGLADIVSEAVPITPTEFATGLVGGKLIGMAAKPATRLAKNFIASAESGALSAGLPLAEQQIAKLGLEIGAQPSGKELGKGLVQGLPRVAKEIKALANSLKKTNKVESELLMSPFHPDAPQPKTISTIQAEAKAPMVPMMEKAPPQKDIYAIQKSAESLESNISQRISEARQWARERLQVPKDMKTPTKTNMGNLAVLQGEFDKSTEANAPAIGAELIYASKRLAKDYLQRGWEQLESMGPAGQRLSTITRSILNNAEQRKGRALAAIDEIFNDLSKEEAANLAEVADKGARPITNKVRIAAAALREMTDVVKREATGLLEMKSSNGQIVPWQPIENFYPHVMDTEATEAALKQPGQWLRDYAAKNTKGNIAAAEEQIRNHLFRSKNKTYGHLEIERKFNAPFYMKDAKQAYKEYFSGVFDRLEMAKGLGNRNQIADKLLSEINDPIKRQIATAYIKLVNGVNPQGISQTELKQAQRGLTRFMSKMMMGASQIVNSTQGLYQAPIESQVGLTSYLKALRDVTMRYPEQKHLASRSGAIASDVLHEMGKMIESQYAKNTGFSATETFNRVLSNTFGRYRAAELFDNLVNQRDLPTTLRQLRKYGINPESVQKRGFFTEYEIDRIGKEIADRSQGRTRPIDMPLATEDAYAGLMYHMRSFVLQNTAFFKQAVYDEAKRGNIKPLAIAIGTAPIIGEVPAAGTEYLGRKRPKGYGARRLDAMLMLGQIGMLRYYFDTAFGGSTEFFTPPAISMGARVGQAGGDLLKGPNQKGGKRIATEASFKVAMRNVAPLVLSKMPAPLAIPSIWAARRAAGQSSKVVPVLGKGAIDLNAAIQRRLDSSGNKP